jgi:hypothetical protein
MSRDVNKDSMILYVGEHNTDDIATLDRWNYE